MQYGNIERLDKDISRLLQGTVMCSSKTLDDSFKLLDEVFEAGCNTFDTAHQYRDGDCERVLGQWIKSRNIRDKVVILDKGAHFNQDRLRVTPYDIASDLHDSLSRLKVEHIDLYALHRDDTSVSVDAIIDTLNIYQEEGKITLFGCSNWSAKRIEQANNYARNNHLDCFSFSSPQYSMIEQFNLPWVGCISISGTRGEKDREYYKTTQLPLFSWSSLAGGFLSGKVIPGAENKFNEYFMDCAVESYGTPDNFNILRRAEELSKELNVTVPQIALAYLFHQGLNLFTLIGSASGEEYKHNAAALDIKLTKQQCEWLINGDRNNY